jgi:ABC-type transport system involved in multi-copper enzyme maturation permease subunit
MLRGIALKGVNVTGTTSSIISKIPKNLAAQISPQAKAAIAKVTPKVSIQTQRYPLWLDLLIVVGFSVVMLGIAIWQFNRQE